MFSVYLQLFASFFKIGLFGFGGGYAILSLIQHEIDIHGWMTQQEFTDIIAISQMTPGPIGINSATYVGYTVAGLAGSVVATMAMLMPSVIIMLVLCKIYVRMKDNQYVAAAFTGLRPVVIGLIAAAALLLMNGENFIDWKSYALFCGALVASMMKMHPMLLIAAAGALGFALYF